MSVGVSIGVGGRVGVGGVTGACAGIATGTIGEVTEDITAGELGA